MRILACCPCVFFYIECRTGLDLIFVLDSSGSVGPTNFQIMLSFVTNVVSNLNIGPDQIRIGLILFNKIAIVQFSLNSYIHDKYITVAGNC